MKTKTETVLETMYAYSFDHGECISIEDGNRITIGLVDVFGRGKNRRVSSLHVAPEFRRKGYATKLMHKVIERHSKANLYLIALPTKEPIEHPGLISLIRFYRRLGFDPVFDTMDNALVPYKDQLSVRMKRPCT